MVRLSSAGTTAIQAWNARAASNRVALAAVHANRDPWYKTPVRRNSALRVAIVGTALSASACGASGGSSVEAGRDVASDVGAGAEDAAMEASVGDVGGADSAAATDTDARGPRPTPTPACLALVAGWNTGFVAGGLARSFYVDVPLDVATGGPWPVVFSWHGMNDPPEPMRDLLRAQLSGPSYRFILVTPDDLNLPLPLGADWDNLELRDGSVEALLFDEILTCLDARFGVDPDRVHSVGFSSGAIVSNMLGVLRGDRIASLTTFSGAYWSNAANGNALAFWPPLTTPNPYVQLMMYGGASDSAFGVNFALIAANDLPYLHAAGHDVIVCDHGGGHSLPTNFGGAQIAGFLRDHPRGIGTSPYAGGLPAGYPTLCVYRPR